MTQHHPHRSHGSRHERHREPEGERREAPEPWPTFEAVVHGRRAIRHFTDRAVAERDMNDLIDAAIVAPTSSNLQPFELVWVRSSSARESLVRACMNQPAAKTAAELVVCVARWDRCEETRRELIAHAERTHEVGKKERWYYDHLVRWVYDQGPLGLYGAARRALLWPALLAVPMPRGPASREDVRVWAVKSAALVCENLMLAARAKGLDTCPLEGADPLRVGAVLGLSRASWKRTWDLTMVIAIGQRDARAEVPPRWRRPRDRLVREL